MAPMTQVQSIAPLDRIANLFTIEGWAGVRARIISHLISLLKLGGETPDRCSVADSKAFFLGEHGACISGIDLIPPLTARARQEATRRGSLANFILADLLVDQADAPVHAGHSAL
jgi:hypothetical protein